MRATARFLVLVLEGPSLDVAPCERAKGVGGMFSAWTALSCEVGLRDASDDCALLVPGNDWSPATTGRRQEQCLADYGMLMEGEVK